MIDKSSTPFNAFPFDIGVKYLGLVLKPNEYRLMHWAWFYGEAESNMSCLFYMWKSRGKRLTIVKSIRKEFLVYWQTLPYISKAIFDKVMFHHFVNREKEK